MKKQDRKNKWSKQKLQNLTKNAHIGVQKKIKKLGYLIPVEHRLFGDKSPMKRPDVVKKLKNSEYHKNGTWSKGLTKYTSKKLWNLSIKLRNQYKNGRIAFMKGKTQPQEIKDRISKAKLGKRWSIERKVERQKFYQTHPEKHPNFICGQKEFVSHPQKALFKCIKHTFKPNVVKMNFPVRTYKTTRFVDVALPMFKLGFEYDGEHWHTNLEKDKQRDTELQKEGWHIIHINKKGVT